jgi:hypothetical protein
MIAQHQSDATNNRTITAFTMMSALMKSAQIEKSTLATEPPKLTASMTLFSIRLSQSSVL